MAELQERGAGWASLVEHVVDELGTALGVVDVSLDVPRFCELLDMVVRWSKRHDLTAARNDEELVDLYLADALVLRARGGTGSWLDIGSGGGAPGLSAAFFQPHPTITLVEPRAKRVAFLRSAVGAFDLRWVSVRKARCEEILPGSADIAVSRATFAPEIWLPEAARIATHEIWVLLAQGDAPQLSGWNPCDDIAYRWPHTDAARRAVQYRRASMP